ncbi:hypothetical protein PRZ48_004228 [Zasmidium cellare]|uniref:Uncharacterized protein n=1 Tax=Zasmidium cellare TaxID=395010 RepID=A0ABR0EYV1_ZASCE|nr:hypothetical protein PRZ48_004228 [Zasmidium cellare]
MSGSFSDMHSPTNGSHAPIAYPPTPSTPTQTDRNAHDIPLSDKVLGAASHSYGLFQGLYDNALVLEQTNAQMGRQLDEKTAAVENWREWHDKHKADILEIQNKVPELENQKAKLQQDAADLSARNEQLIEDKAKAIQELTAQHEASLASVHEQHSGHIEDREGTIVALSQDATELRDGFAQLQAENVELRIGKAGAEEAQKETLRKFNRATEQKTEFKGKLDKERRDHIGKLQAKQRAIDKLTQEKASIESVKQQKIDEMGHLVQDGEKALRDAQVKERAAAADVQTAKEEIDGLRNDLGKEQAVREDAQSKANESETVRQQAFAEISTLKAEVEKSNGRAEEETAKALQAEQALAEERQERLKDGRDLDEFLTKHRKRYHSSVGDSAEGPLSKKQRV